MFVHVVKRVKLSHTVHCVVNQYFTCYFGFNSCVYGIRNYANNINGNANEQLSLVWDTPAQPEASLNPLEAPYLPNDTPETHLITRPIPVVVPYPYPPPLCLLYKFACSKCIKLSIEHKHTQSCERGRKRKREAVTDSSVGRTCFQQHENALQLLKTAIHKL